MAVFGLPFFTAGLFLTLAGLRVLPVLDAGELPEFARPVLLFMGLAFVMVGGSLVFGRSWTTIDSSQRTILKEWGLLVPMRAQTFRLDGDTAVILGFKEGDSDTADQFPVGLKSSSGADLPLCSSTQYPEARALAAAVARHLHLEIEDASSDHPLRLSADQADLPLQHRLRLEQKEEGLAERPSTARSEVSEENGVERIVIPMPRIHPVVLAFMLIPIAIPLVVIGPLDQFFRQTQTPAPVGWFFLGFVILICGVMPAGATLHAFAKSRFGRTIVTVSTRGIRIQQRGAWKTKTIATLDASEIMDVDYSTKDSMLASAKRTAEQQIIRSGQRVSGLPVVGERTERVLAALSRFAKGRGITVKTRQGLTTFGQGLPDEEIRYLHWVVRRALVRGAA